ncbi:MAG TPA: gamma-glutamyltransferase [Solirubrobacteraceae bacterium]|nr:gamma-glutamyltransferase [Solirubrobacteraceae bacterium]
MRRALRPLVATIAVVVPLALVPAAPARPSAAAKAPTAIGFGGGAATVDVDGTRAAIHVLRRGGNAVDAAVAAAGVLGVVEPYSCGIGGGGFMLVYSARDRRVHTIDSRETAPAAMTPNAFEGLTSFEAQRVSGMSVGVPGTVRAWQKALGEYGTWSLRRALRPGIRVARRGFTVDPTFFEQTLEAEKIFADFPSTAALYLDADGTPRDVGATIRNPDLARTYRLVARGGPGAFYSGALARAIVDTVRHPPLRAGATRAVRPGLMTLADLARYRAVDRPPTKVTHRGLDVYGMGPPSSGGSTVGEALNILAAIEREHGPLASMPRELALHYYLEASRYAYADRGDYLGDPDYVSVPLAGMLDPAYAAQRAALITARAADPPVVAPGEPPGATSTAPSVQTAHLGSTTNLTVSDRYGNVVDYTFTIEQTGGNGMVVPGYGFLLNNELTDFNLASNGSSPPSANQVAGGKRPRSSIAPTIVLRGDRPVLAVGSPGGASIITTVLQILVNRLDLGLSLPEAIAAPRLSQRNSATTQSEAPPLETPEQPALEARGQVLKPTTDPPSAAYIGAATGLERFRHGLVLAAAEPFRRGGGSALVAWPAWAWGR